MARGRRGTASPYFSVGSGCVVQYFCPQIHVPYMVEYILIILTFFYFARCIFSALCRKLYLKYELVDLVSLNVSEFNFIYNS